MCQRERGQVGNVCCKGHVCLLLRGYSCGLLSVSGVVLMGLMADRLSSR